MNTDRNVCATRAAELAEKHLFAREILMFYREIAHFQADLYSDRDPVWALPRLLALVERCGPEPLARAAAELRNRAMPDWQRLLQDFRTAPIEEAFFAKVLLQPRAEFFAELSPIVPERQGQPLCPICESRAVVGVLRPEGHGAKRLLLCSLCATEWSFSRVLCPNCGERNFESLPVFTASEFDYARVDACDSCKTYLKTIDLSKNGLAVPVVDELATIPLDLWAQEQGYTKLELNLLGM